MAGPYNITQVDVPGLLGAYQNQQDRRVNQMLLQRKMAAEDRQIAKETALTAAYSKIRPPGSTQQRGGDPASTGGGLAAPYASAPSATPSAPGISSAYAVPAPVADGIDRNRPVGSPLSPAVIPDPMGGDPAATAMAPASTATAPVAPAPQTWVDSNKDLLDSLMTVDAPAAFAMRTQLQGLDDAQIKKAKGFADTLATVGEHLSSFRTPQARAAELQRIKPQLLAEGIPEDKIAGADLSDAGIQWMVVHGMDIDKIIAREKDDRSFAETERHNRATESSAAGNLEVRRGALGLAKGREGRIASGIGKKGGDVAGLSNDALLGSLLGR